MKDDKKSYLVEDTLWFFEFGFTPDEFEAGADDLLNKVFEKALFDATMEGAFNARCAEEDKNNALDKKKTVAPKMMEKLGKLENNAGKEKFDEWHNKACEEICNNFKGIKDKKNKEQDAFSYGNAQKFVNMTLKYLYMLSNSASLATKEHEVLNKVKGNLQYLHMPIDSYIIDALFEKDILNWDELKHDTVSNLGKLVGGGSRQEHEKIKELKKRPSAYINVAWSNWNYDLYKAVEDKIKDEFKKRKNDYGNILEWENALWIEQAKLHRK